MDSWSKILYVERIFRLAVQVGFYQFKKKKTIFQPRKTCFFPLRGSNTYDENFELAILGVDMFDFAWPARYPAKNINSLLVNVDNPINNG